jgi:Tfp pilus assembly protein FimT
MVAERYTTAEASGPGRSKRQGFSFVEICVVVLISSFLIGGLYTILITGNNSWEISRDRTEIHQYLRTAVDWMRKDLRQAGLSTITGVPADGAWYTSISFQIPSNVVSGSIVWSATIQYAIGGTGNQQLLRTIGAQQKVIAQRFNVIRFRRQSSTPNIIEINAQVQKNTPQHGLISMTRTTQVTIRN